MGRQNQAQQLDAAKRMQLLRNSTRRESAMVSRKSKTEARMSASMQLNENFMSVSVSLCLVSRW